MIKLASSWMFTLGVLTVTGCGASPATVEPKPNNKPALRSSAGASESVIIDQRVTSLEGEEVDLASYRGKTLLIVNTASKCGFTPQYEGLQTLYERFRERGLVVIGFPSNDFGNQEPGSAEEIATFCRRNYGVTFPMMAKVHTKGKGQAEIYRALTEDTPDGIRGEVRWNFTKFLVDPDGRVVARFEPDVKPLDPRLVSAIEELLPNGNPAG